MKRIVVWQRLDAVGVEYTEVQEQPLRLEGDLVLIEDSERCAVTYRVACDDTGRTSSASVRLKREGTLQECQLSRSPEGLWTVNGAPAPQLQGLADVDLSVTPSTNTPPIRRLRLAVGQRAEVTAAWVRFPSLEVLPLRQIYRRAGPDAYVYEAPELSFAAELRCDDDGVVRTYGGLWRECP